MLFAAVKRPIPTGLRRAEAATIRRGIRFFCSLILSAEALHAAAAQPFSSPLAAPVKSIVNQYCISCHDADVKKGGLDLEGISRDGVTEHAEQWERVIRKLRRLGYLETGVEPPVATGYDPLRDTAPELARTMAASVQQRIAFGDRAGQHVRRIGAGFGYEGEEIGRAHV